MLDKFKDFLGRFWHWPVLLVLAASFFIAASSFNFYLQKDGFVKWISPDETANYTFAKLYAQEGELSIYEKYNLYAKDIIHPRSFRSDHGSMKPVSFLGLALIFGRVAGWIGFEAIPYLTPAFGGLAIIFYYLLVGRLFSKRNALISASILAFFPVFIYYSARSLFHNVLFISLLLGGLYFSVRMGDGRQGKYDWKGLLSAALGALLTGAAVMSRSSELLWVGPLFFFIWAANFRKVGILRLVIFLAFLGFSLLPAFYWNQILYGGVTASGYPEVNRSISTLKDASAGLVQAPFAAEPASYELLLKKIKDNVFYFGFNPKEALKTFKNYFILMFPWLFWPAAVGFLSFISSWRQLKKRHFVFLAGYFFLSATLVLYYGSWKFNDNPDPSMITIGNSYTRYWLPIYLGAIPFFSLLIIRLTDFKDQEGGRLMKYLKVSTTALSRFMSVAIVAFISVTFVLFGSNEGLVETFKKQRAAKKDLDKVLSLTEKNAVIITRYHDKLFFPERKVIIGNFEDKNMIIEYANLAEFLPVYYYNFNFADKDFEYLNSRKLADFGLGIEEVERVTNEFTLYRILDLPEARIEAGSANKP